LLQVVIDVDLKQLSPFGQRHFSEHRVRSPVIGRSRLPGSIHDFEELLLFKVEIEFRPVGNLETFWQSQSYGLLREPVNQYPSKQCSRYEIALIGKFVESQRTAACQIEMVQHLGNVHRSPLPRVSRSNPENPVPKLIVFRFREEGLSVYLLHTEITRNVLQHRDARHPDVAREQLSDKICPFGFAWLRGDRLRCTIAHIRQLYSLRETRPEHRCFALGLLFRGLVLEHIPVFLKNSVFDSQDVGGNPICRRAANTQSTVNNYKISVSHDQIVLVLQSWWRVPH